MADLVTVESHCVRAEIDPARFEDPRFTYCLSRVSDPKVPDGKKLVFYGRMLALVFGDDGAYEVMCDLADAAGGSVSATLFNEFYADILEQLGAKNS